MITLVAEQFEVYEGKKEYVVDLVDGDSQIDFHIRSDTDVAVYVALGDKVIPLGKGTVLKDRLMVKDVKWMMVVPAKQSAQVAIQVFQVPRTLKEVNDGKPVAVFVPEPPPIDLRAQVNRLIAQKLEQQGEYLVDPEDIDLPADMDEEFGVGSTQLQDDDELEEMIDDAQRKREEAVRKSQGGQAEGEEGEGGVPEGERADPDGGGSKKRRSSAKPRKAVAKEAAEEVEE